MRLSRRQLLQASAIGGAALAAPGAFAFAPAVRSGAAPRVLLGDAPQTGFERTGTWTTHEDEIALLTKLVADAPNTVTVDEIGRTAQGRPINLVTLGLGAESSGKIVQNPATMVLGSQHGNEPAGRDANLIFIRDLAYANLEDPSNADLKALLAEQTILVVPSANPDGRERNSRANSKGIDINRDHLTLVTEEARAFADVIMDFEPFMALDLHEYGPSAPVVYDDELLYLWPRNLNVDEAVRTMAQEYCEDYIKKDGEAAGYSADEYGLYKVGPNIGHQPIGGTTNDYALQMAGGADEGICRNAMGLRHTMGILVESAVTQSATRPGELNSTENLRRRVASQRVVLDSMLRFQIEQGEAAKAVTLGAMVRKKREGKSKSAPVFFSGQDDARPLLSDSEYSVAAMSGYQLSDEDRLLANDTTQGLGRALDGQGIKVNGSGYVSMEQFAEPLIPLLLDDRGSRSITNAQPID